MTKEEKSDANPAGGVSERRLRVAIIGSGPAGFYAAESVFRDAPGPVELDMFDRLPTPFGLVRGGVAPDHQSIKKVVRVYEKTAQREGFRFFGNVTLGTDLHVADLREHYDEIIYAVGNEFDRRLGIPGEGIKRCTPASVFVGWYNGHPDYRDAQIDLSVRRVAVVGNGNVAIDIARILSKTADELAGTDIAPHALSALEESQVEEVWLFGRRGPVQAAFTPAELREFRELTEAEPIIDGRYLELDPHSEAELASAGSRVKKNMAIMGQFASAPTDKPRQIHFRFFSSPTEILADDDGGVRAIRVERNRLEPRGERLRAVGTGEFEEIDVQMIMPAIGFVGHSIEGVPFNEKWGVVNNVDGSVVDLGTDQVVPHEYVVGWARSGPSGLIGSHKKAAAAVVARLHAARAAETSEPRVLPGLENIVALLKERGVAVVSFDDWTVLDSIERERGERRGAPREKITEVDQMLEVLGKK